MTDLTCSEAGTAQPWGRELACPPHTQGRAGSGSDLPCHVEEGESHGRKKAVPYLFEGLSLESHLGHGSTAGHFNGHGMGLGYE